MSNRTLQETRMIGGQFILALIVCFIDIRRSSAWQLKMQLFKFGC